MKSVKSLNQDFTQTSMANGKTWKYLNYSTGVKTAALIMYGTITYFSLGLFRSHLDFNYSLIGKKVCFINIIGDHCNIFNTSIYGPVDFFVKTSEVALGIVFFQVLSGVGLLILTDKLLKILDEKQAKRVFHDLKTHDGLKMNLSDDEAQINLLS